MTVNRSRHFPTDKLEHEERWLGGIIRSTLGGQVSPIRYQTCSRISRLGEMSSQTVTVLSIHIRSHGIPIGWFTDLRTSRGMSGAQCFKVGTRERSCIR